MDVEENRRRKAARSKARDRGFRGETRMAKVAHVCEGMSYPDMNEFLLEVLNGKEMTEEEWHESK